MTTVIIIAVIYGIYRLCKSAADRAQADRAERERQRIREEQAAQREEMRLMRERAKAETRRQIEAEKARIAWQKRQDAINRQAQAERERLRKEQERQAKEQERQAAEIAKHEAEIERMRHVLAQATADIDFLQERSAELYAQLDNVLLLQAGTVPGSSAHTKYQSKIVTLHNQIHAAETKLSRAQYQREQAQRKLA